MALFDRFGRPIRGDSHPELPSGVNVPPQDANKTESKPDGKKAKPFYQNISKILGITSVAAFLIWFLGVSSNGFYTFFSDVPGLQIYPFAIGVCLFVFFLFHKWISGREKSKWWYLIPLIICFIVLAGTIWAVRIKIQSWKEPKPYPHFEFDVASELAPNNFVVLTNDFLITRDFTTNASLPLGHLIFPVTNQNNVKLNLMVVNNGPSDAEDIEVAIFLPEEFSCSPEYGWNAARFGSDFNLRKTYGTTNTFICWYIKIPSLLCGNGTELPLIHFGHVPNQISDNWNFPDLCSLVARAKNSPAQAISFQPTFILVPQNGPDKSPSVILGKLINGHEVFKSPIRVFLNVK